MTPKHLKKIPLRGPKGGGASHPAAALRPTLAVTITPVTFASAVAAPGPSGATNFIKAVQRCPNNPAIHAEDFMNTERLWISREQDRSVLYHPLSPSCSLQTQKGQSVVAGFVPFLKFGPNPRRHLISPGAIWGGRPPLLVVCLPPNASSLLVRSRVEDHGPYARPALLMSQTTHST